MLFYLFCTAAQLLLCNFLSNWESIKLGDLCMKNHFVLLLNTENLLFQSRYHGELNISLLPSKGTHAYKSFDDKFKEILIVLWLLKWGTHNHFMSRKRSRADYDAYAAVQLLTLCPLTAGGQMVL